MTVAARGILPDGRSAEWHDDLERYRIIGADGTTVLLDRAYDVFEQGQKAEREARNTTTSVDTNLRSKLRNGVIELRALQRRLQTAMGRTNQQLAGNTTATADNLRSLAGEVIVVADAVAGLAKLMSGDLSNADTGPS